MSKEDKNGNLQKMPTKELRSPQHSPQESTTPQLQLKPEVPTQNFFTPLRSIEMETDHGNDTTELQQHQAPSSQAGCLPL
jgi:hypothetical protein